MYYSLSILQSMLPIKKCILICFAFLFVMGNDIIVDRSIVSVSFYLSLALCKSLVILVRPQVYWSLAIKYHPPETKSLSSSSSSSSSLLLL